ncbi:D-arabinono-1,4-lactone oxidase [Arthrobacter sp. ISL-30]|uniref:D-arabinono-1,4-lactone oxidase n=1 Tax=Arthrobacter sp. ISL-30 TaxID=2819109 RepID=UPI001BEBE611|nr:D-arabinono-1,4-lactone oxidase [Arthrobacter sp. ISL-30]MBT2512535.1 FAD-binding protein [Arthrobacter sp. ISL-30]
MKNWAGNLDYAASSVHSPSTVEELAEIVASSDEVKALGSRHCFNRIADTQGTHIVVSGLDGKPELDVDRGIVRVPGGNSYGELAVYLQSNGYALHNMASLPHISVAGAVQTGTHGSGVGNPALSSAVKAIELVRASGEIERLEAGDGAGGDEFLGSVVGLGALGIVTSLDLAVQPTFDIRQQVFEGLPWDTLLENFDAAASSAYSVSFFTDYYGDTIGQVWRKALASEGRYLPKPVAEEFFGAPAATRPRHPLPEMSGENCTEQLDVPGPWLDRLPHFRHEFTPSNGDELQSEYLLPREHAAAALAEMRSMADKLVPLLYVSEIRTVAADDFWLSPSYRQDSVAIHLTWKPRQPEVEAVLPEIEERLAPFGARPHWGKLFDADAGSLEQLYPSFADFRSLVEKHDPQGKFRNAYLERVIFGG